MASRVDAMVIERPSRREASGHRRRCPWVGAVTVVRIDGVDFPALGRYEKDYATSGYDYDTRNPEQTHSTPD
jgi:hypothetical protein